jgi:UDP-N-acetylmuramate: L-alanyl-gamma-D-glutamyl-meso-diaminopimelate ligase
MHIHILGICGTFMGGLALIARAAGHRVTGCDTGIYPPMSTQLNEQGVELIDGFGADQVALNPDLYVVGNVVTRGNRLMEAILDGGLRFTSGPQWLAENILQGKWVLGVAGTHGKTTTSSMLAWILDYAGLQPGFLIGGIPQNFGLSARIGPGDSPFFVIEADEYDTAFFDKRSKFLHYRSRTTILNNLEFDHADIFPDLAAIETQFHHLVRTLPAKGLVVANGRDANLERVLQRGCWTSIERFGVETGWSAHATRDGFDVLLGGLPRGTAIWDVAGEHNRMNALAALAAARHAGVPVAQGVEALGAFRNVKRRLEVRGVVNGITVYDDFAHHPTAIDATIEALRGRVGGARIIAVLEPRSNTMKLGVWKDSLAASLDRAESVFCYTGNLGWDAAGALASLGAKCSTADDVGALVEAIAREAKSGDHVLIMSNGGFGGIHEKLLTRLARR